MSRELSSTKSLIDKLKGEKDLLEGTIARLNQEISTNNVPVSSPTVRGEESDELALIKQEVSRWEADYNSAVQEKEALQADVTDLQNKLDTVQTNYEKVQRELHFSNKASNVKVSYI